MNLVVFASWVSVLLILTLIILSVFWIIEVKNEANIEIDKMDKYKSLRHWTEKGFIIWRYQKSAMGCWMLPVKVAIKRAKKIIRKYERDLEQLEQKEDEKRALEVQKKLEETLKECGYR